MHLVEKIEDNRAGCHAKGNHIGQRIEFLSYGRRYAESPCHQAIEEVKHGSYDYHQYSILVLTVEGTASCHTAADEIAASNGVRNVSFNHIILIGGVQEVKEVIARIAR